MLKDPVYSVCGARNIEPHTCSVTFCRAITWCQKSWAENCIWFGLVVTFRETVVCHVDRAGFHTWPLLNFLLDCVWFVGRNWYGRNK